MKLGTWYSIHEVGKWIENVTSKTTDVCRRVIKAALAFRVCLDCLKKLVRSSRTLFETIIPFIAVSR